MIKKIAACLALLVITWSSTTFAAEFSADTITDMQTGGLTGKIYFKNREMSRNEMMGMINIINGSMIYKVFTDTKKYHVSNLDELEKNNPMAGARDFKTWAAKNNLKKIGTESVEGFKCDIYEGDVKFDKKGQHTNHMKFWVSTKLNYPLKTESTMAPPVGRISSRLENIKIGKQPNHLFEVPSGYTEAATMGEAMGMPTFMQGGGDNADGQPAGEMPSKEQKGEIMKKMKDLMNKMKKD